jgi:XTP/dITP diphosphohydrolase
MATPQKLQTRLEKPIVLATTNEGKIAEFNGLLADFDIPIKSLKDFGPLPPVEEDEATFEDNAYKKAAFTAKALGLPALADDSGLMVKALGGLPGVNSARYAGETSTDEENNLKLLNAMKDLAEREASFMCIIAIAVPRGPALIYEGRCDGSITQKLIGNRGFGYDPLFYFPPLKKTFAQMTPEEKNLVSHRGKAMAELRSEFDKVMIWLAQRMAEEPF